MGGVGAVGFRSFEAVGFRDSPSSVKGFLSEEPLFRFLLVESSAVGASRYSLSTRHKDRKPKPRSGNRALSTKPLSRFNFEGCKFYNLKRGWQNGHQARAKDALTNETPTLHKRYHMLLLLLLLPIPQLLLLLLLLLLLQLRRYYYYYTTTTTTPATTTTTSKRLGSLL